MGFPAWRRATKARLGGRGRSCRFAEILAARQCCRGRCGRRDLGRGLAPRWLSAGGLGHHRNGGSYGLRGVGFLRTVVRGGLLHDGNGRGRRPWRSGGRSCSLCCLHDGNRRSCGFLLCGRFRCRLRGRCFRRDHGPCRTLPLGRARGCTRGMCCDGGDSRSGGLRRRACRSGCGHSVWLRAEGGSAGVGPTASGWLGAPAFSLGAARLIHGWGHGGCLSTPSRLAVGFGRGRPAAVAASPQGLGKVRELLGPPPLPRVWRIPECGRARRHSGSGPAEIRVALRRYMSRKVKSH